MSRKLLYPTSLILDVKQLQGYSLNLISYDVHEPISEEHTDAEILITWTNTNLADAAQRLHSLRWIQSLAAGPNDVLSAGFPGRDDGSLVVTTGSGLHDHTVAEHALALLLTAARRTFEMRDYQREGRWPAHLGGALPDRPKGQFTSLRGAKVLIWGFGNIARTLTPHLKSLGAEVRGVARSRGVRDGVEVFEESELEDLLRSTDALVMILPGSDSTKNALGERLLRTMQKHAWVVNVGRGTTVDEDALASALEEGRIGGAALDVFVTEPLPAESRLWKAPNCVISPHAAGGRPQEAERLIQDNLRRYLAGQELRNVI